MQTGITTQPAPAPARAEDLQLIYTLDRYDYLAWWMYAWMRDRPKRKKPSSIEVELWLMGILVWLAAALIAIYPSLDDPGKYGFVLALGPVVCWGLGLLCCLFLAGPGRRRFLYLWQKFRKGMYLIRITTLAEQYEEEGETINKRRIHWFTVLATGIVEISELHQREDGLDRYEYREARCPWTTLTDVVVEERHVFLPLSKEAAFIVPIHCFRDARAADEFVQTVRNYKETACRAAAGAITAAPDHPAGEREVC